MQGKKENNLESQAQIVIASKDLEEDMSFFNDLGFRLNNIFPDDDPEVALMSGHGLHIRLDKKVNLPPSTIYILTDDLNFGDGKKKIIAPNGTVVKVLPKNYQITTPVTKHKFEVRQLENNDPWVIGRAGMLYRDLIPDRLGGSIMASHINIPKGGPVPDMVHYHTIGFQLIYCYKGWVKLVYEDQGPPFILRAGDCVTQPPEIRHRVLEASDNLEVIEIGVPAEHMTSIDHEMELPTKKYIPEREFQGQTFCHHQLKEAVWIPWRMAGFEYRDTGIKAATNGVAAVHTARVKNKNMEQQWMNRDIDILFTFILQGEIKLNVSGNKSHSLHQGDAFVIPPNFKYRFSNFSDNLELLEVTLPGI